MWSEYALEVVDAVARGGSFSAAAQELHRVPSAISYTVRQLENWLAVPLFELIGADPRGIFAFRHTSAGAVFHLVAIGATVVLSYYDLFARVVLIWVSFALASALATWLQWDAGFAAFGWGYMAGAVVGASVGIAMVAESTVRLVYLLFVGNNPAVVGPGGRVL